MKTLYIALIGIIINLLAIAGNGYLGYITGSPLHWFLNGVNLVCLAICLSVFFGELE